MIISKTARHALVAAALGAFTAPFLAAIVLPVWAQNVPADGVSIANFTFDPPTVTIRAGTKVTWTNKDDIPHGIAWVNNLFTRSKPLDTDDTVSVTFTTPGTYKYFCYLHPQMVGTVVVEATTGSNTK